MIFRFPVALTSILLLALSLSPLRSDAADLIVFSTVAAKPGLDPIALDFERQTNHRVQMRYATAAELKAEIEKGASCDVAILNSAGIDDLAKQGRVVASSKVVVFRTGIGIAVKKGEAAPTILTSEDLKQALVKAKKVAMTASGATAPAMKRIFEQFGITDLMADKTEWVSGMTAADAVARGMAELGITQVTEILDTPGAQLVGPLPAEVQVTTVWAAAITAASKNAAAAEAYVKKLFTPEARTVMKAKGLEPG